jgi:hypothetical protein
MGDGLSASRRLYKLCSPPKSNLRPFGAFHSTRLLFSSPSFARASQESETARAVPLLGLKGLILSSLWPP